MTPQNSKAKAIERGEAPKKFYSGQTERFPAENGPKATVCRKQPAGSGSRYKCAMETVRGLF